MRLLLALWLAAGASRAPAEPVDAPEAKSVGPDQAVTLAPGTDFEKEALRRALELLAGIDAGRPIVEFLKTEGVKIYFAEMTPRTHGGWGHDAAGRPAIMLSHVGSGELKHPDRAAAYYAVVLAHEGTHARQNLEWKLVEYVEEEVECFYKEMEVLHALHEQGLPYATFELEVRYRLVRIEGGPKDLADKVRDAYEAEVYERARDEIGADGEDTEKRQQALVKEWRRDGKLDGHRPIAELIREARKKKAGDERLAGLKRAKAHWEEVHADFVSKEALWPELTDEATSGSTSR